MITVGENNINKPTNLGYAFGEIDDGILIMLSEYGSGLSRAINSHQKNVVDNKPMIAAFKEIFDFRDKTMTPIMKRLLDGELLDDDFLKPHIIQARFLLLRLHDYEDEIKFMKIRDTLNTIISQLDRRLESNHMRPYHGSNITKG